MEVNEIKQVVETFRRQGKSDLEIAKSFVNLFVLGKVNCEQCNALLSFVDYHIPNEIIKASPKAQIAFAKDFLKK